MEKNDREIRFYYQHMQWLGTGKKNIKKCKKH